MWWVIGLIILVILTGIMGAVMASNPASELGAFIGLALCVLILGTIALCVRLSWQEDYMKELYILRMRAIVEPRKAETIQVPKQPEVIQSEND